MNRIFGICILVIGSLAALTLPTLAGRAVSATGAVLPQPCAACHLPSAAGVPGTFPPLRGNLQALIATPAGRRYTVLTVSHGLAGPLVIDGKRYSGVMPAQSLRNEDIARILNGLLAPGQRAFTAREVADIRATGVGMAGAQVARLRPAIKGR